MPEVSVIIPIYNTAAYLRKALDSAGFENVPILTTDPSDTKGIHPGVSMLGARSVLLAARNATQESGGTRSPIRDYPLHATEDCCMLPASTYILWTVTTFWIRKPSGTAMICARKENWTSSSSMQNR